MCDIDINIFNKIREVNYKYMLNYLQISIRVWILPFEFGHPIFLNSISVKIFYYFGQSLIQVFRGRVKKTFKIPF